MQKEAIRIDLDGFFAEPELVQLTTTSVTEIYETPELDPENEEQEQPEPTLIGYRVSVPVPPGLYQPRYDLTAWRSAVSDHNNALAAYQTALTAHDPESENDPPTPPAPVDLTQFWVEGLTPQEVDALRNAPRPETVHDQVAQLQSENALLALELVDTQIALNQAQNEQAALLLALVEAEVI